MMNLGRTSCLAAVMAMGSVTMADESTDTKIRDLTPEETRVIVRKGTERPFSGKYNNHFAKGAYACRRCGAALFRSEHKFRSRCGWPSFDDCIEGAVRRTRDADGRRTEIACVKCGGHLGHVFEGEGHTSKNTRHCVNSVSLDFVPASEAKLRRAVFAGGCFWGVEHLLKRVAGVVATTVGYTGGRTEKPTYLQVSSHATGHAEAVEVLFDASQTTFRELAKAFFELHDPTQVSRQGPDVGRQYRSEIFYLDEDQKRVAEELIAELKAKGCKVATRVSEAGRFWPAEEYHQDYYSKAGKAPYCHRRVRRF